MTREKAIAIPVAWLPEWRDVDTIDDLRLLIDASILDAGKPKQEQSFSNRTAVFYKLIAKRLRSRT